MCRKSTKKIKHVVVNRAKLDDNSRLLDFTEKLEAACIATVEQGKMTKDLALLLHGSKYCQNSEVPFPLWICNSLMCSKLNCLVVGLLRLNI